MEGARLAVARSTPTTDFKMQRTRHNLLALPAVLARTGLGKTAIYAAMRECGFPRPIKIGPRRVAWLEDEVDTWIEERIKERDAFAANSRCDAPTARDAAGARRS
jgi:prophage regulatory protein